MKAPTQDNEIARIKGSCESLTIIVRYVPTGRYKGLDIREYHMNTGLGTPGYTGWGKKGIHIPIDDMDKFKNMMTRVFDRKTLFSG